MESTLITITTCNRLQEVKKYVWDYISFCNSNANFNFLLAQDGNLEEYSNFCNEYEIPMIFSDEREGVGLSKNRVLTQFPDFDHYFFLDDDVELYDSNVFQLVINTAKALSLDHMCITPFGKPSKSFIHEGKHIEFGNKGGGYFNYFTGSGLKKVGGWHDEFAKWRRYGHTEHSVRYVNAGLAEYGFNSIKEAVNMVILHDPGHVTTPLDSHDENEFSEPEQKILNQKLSFYPVNTISQYHFNGFSVSNNKKVENFLKSNTRNYPLLSGKERRHAKSDYYFFLFTQSYWFKAIYYFCLAFVFNFKSVNIKHWIVTKILRKK